jgi:ABC-2 type transport system permease protein
MKNKTQQELPKKTKVRYSQTKAMLAITKASLISLFKNPSTVVFSILFPLIFIVAFGLIGGGSNKITVGLSKDINKDNPIYKALENIDTIELKSDKSEGEFNEELSKGNLDAILDIQYTPICNFCELGPPNVPHYTISIKTSSASPQNGAIFTSILNGISDKVNLASTKQELIKVRQSNSESVGQTTASGEDFLGPNFTDLNLSEIEGRKYKQIDFILPGQLGFSLLSIGVFSTAFVLINLRETLVLKRFFATPISRMNILFGEGLARLVFAAMQAAIIVGIGTIFLDFTLINGWVTLLQIVALSIVGVIIFLGFGFIVSGIAKNENAVPPLANLITMPQFILSGTFFPIEAFPEWLQPISRALPLTFLNDAMRKVAFEGASFSAIQTDLLWLVVWGIIVYILAIKFFKWDL